MKDHLTKLEDIYSALSKSIAKLDATDVEYKRQSAKVAIDRAVGALKSILRENSDLLEIYSHGRADYSFEGAGNKGILCDLSQLIKHISDL